MVDQVSVDDVNHVSVVSTGIIEEEHGGVSSGTGARDSKADPVDDRFVLGLAHSPDISFFNVVSHIDFSSLLVNNINSTVIVHLEGLVVRSVLFGFLSHETNVRYITHSCDIELSVDLAVAEDGVVHLGVASVRDNNLSILEFVILVPHLSGVTDNIGNGSIDNNIRRNMEVGNSLSRVNHSNTRSSLVASVEVSDNSSSLISREFLVDGSEN